MSESEPDVVSLVTMLVTSLVDDTDAVKVTSQTLEDGTLSLEVSCAEDDIGKVIGRQGRVVKAIRTLSRACASQDGSHVEVEVLG